MILAASFDVNEPENWVNRALQYGDGLFETMRWQAGRLPLLQWHQKRLEAGLKRLQIEAFDWEPVLNALQKSSLQSAAVIKLVVFRQHSGRGYRPTTAASDWLLLADKLEQQPTNPPIQVTIAERSLPANPGLAGLKHLNRLDQVLLSAELNGRDDVSDLLVCDASGHLLEGSHSNLLVWLDGQLFTPDLNQAGVNGVALAWLATHLPIVTRPIHRDELGHMESLWLCNSVRGLIPVAGCDELQSFATSGHIHDKMLSLWNDLWLG